ncbi:MAG: alpha-amylase family glycosyl hydrolase [Jaaginema sp. PMC 1079.18]|nr:alpha-amylase family glycosyl hydrolase [Jaaginema sp. PMC 1080.18]MEC4850755.1 alpha-amylase family glycosyl hydrolase [Jaaginema sp. PMC 1079.18]MEC4865335.1 alpha-amylase family glycosyl hydrolase [Jaaginema sp. PMC 1078.18]
MSKTHSVEFKLFAPYNEKASLVGCFSNWEEIPMKKDDRGYFRTQVDLEDGTYEYKFCVQSLSWFFEEKDRWVTVTDPYATDINDSNDNSIVNIKEGNAIGDTYVWQDDDTPLPANEELVIYELFVAGFEEKRGKLEGTFQDVIDKLDYLQDLGINAIELLPMQEYPGDFHQGYNPRHYFAVETSYGHSEDLKRLIDNCHKRGIRFIMDGIFNHSDTECPLTHIDHDYWYHHDPQHEPENTWGPEFNYEHYDEKLDIKPAWEYIGNVIEFWIKEFHIDGIRFDAVRQIDNFDFLYWVTQRTREIASMKPFFNMAEYIPESADVAGFEGPMDACWHESFRQVVIAHVCGDRFDLENLKDVIDGRRQGYEGTTSVINYISTHDGGHIMAALGERKIFEEPAFRRAKLGAVILMTALGVPLMWMGSELGEYSNYHDKPMDWTFLKNDLNCNLLDYYKGLIHLRKTNPALRTDNLDFFYEDPEAKVLAYTRWNDEGDRVVVVANFSDQFLGEYHVPHFPTSGTWHEWTLDYHVEVHDNQLVFDLGPWEAQIFLG